jgi:hypothetical protein
MHFVVRSFCSCCLALWSCMRCAVGPLIPPYIGEGEALGRVQWGYCPHNFTLLCPIIYPPLPPHPPMKASLCVVTCWHMFHVGLPPVRSTLLIDKLRIGIKHFASPWWCLRSPCWPMPAHACYISACWWSMPCWEQV